jgi:hypothetical protein
LQNEPCYGSNIAGAIMFDPLEKLKTTIAANDAREGKGTGPLSKILSHLAILAFVYLLAALVKDRWYVSALVILGLGITRFGIWAFVAAAAYFAFVSYWAGVWLSLTAFATNVASFWVGLRNVKRNLFSKKTNVDAFEGMHDSVFALILEAMALFVGVVSTGTLASLAWAFFGIVMLFHLGRYGIRLGSPWRRLHNSLMVRYAGIAGYQMGTAQKEGREFDLAEALFELVKSALPSKEDEQIRELVESAQIKMREFSDRENLRRFFEKKFPAANANKIAELLDDIHRSLLDPQKKGERIRWTIAELVENDFGTEERTKYLDAVIFGKAT